MTRFILALTLLLMGSNASAEIEICRMIFMPPDMSYSESSAVPESDPHNPFADVSGTQLFNIAALNPLVFNPFDDIAVPEGTDVILHRTTPLYASSRETRRGHKVDIDGFANQMIAFQNNGTASFIRDAKLMTTDPNGALLFTNFGFTGNFVDNYYNRESKQWEPLPLLSIYWQSELQDTLKSYHAGVDERLRQVVSETEKKLPEEFVEQVLVTDPSFDEVIGMLRLFLSAKGYYTKNKFEHAAELDRDEQRFLLPSERTFVARGTKSTYLEQQRNKGLLLVELGKFRVKGAASIRPKARNAIARALKARARQLPNAKFVSHVATRENARLNMRDYGFKIAEEVDLTKWYRDLLEKGKITQEEFDKANKVEIILEVDSPTLMAAVDRLLSRQSGKPTSSTRR